MIRLTEASRPCIVAGRSICDIDSYACMMSLERVVDDASHGQRESFGTGERRSAQREFGRQPCRFGIVTSFSFIHLFISTFIKSPRIDPRSIVLSDANAERLGHRRLGLAAEYRRKRRRIGDSSGKTSSSRHRSPQHYLGHHTRCNSPKIC